jgi:hypothetical protein
VTETCESDAAQAKYLIELWGNRAMDTRPEIQAAAARLVDGACRH